jgi:hypothetical protein
MRYVIDVSTCCRCSGKFWLNDVYYQIKMQDICVTSLNISIASVSKYCILIQYIWRSRQLNFNTNSTLTEVVMEFHYEVIAKMAADISRQMLRLNTQLDRVIDKQNELADPEKQKSIAIDLINDLKWNDASKICADQAKEEDKRTKLDEEETHIRSSLEALREQLVKVSNGETPEPSTQEPSTQESPEEE